MKMKNTAIIMIFTLVLAIAGFGVSFLITPQWTAEATLKESDASALGNYYALNKTYQLLDGTEVTQDQTISKNVYQVFWQKLASPDNIRQFWINSDYYKQKVVNDFQQDTELLNKLSADFQFFTQETQGLKYDGIQLTLDNPKMAAELLNNYILYTNELTKQQLYQDLITRWKTLFDLVQQAATNELGTIAMKGNEVKQDWSGKLAVMKSVSKLDNQLVSYQYLTRPMQPLSPTFPNRILFLFYGALIGLMIGIIMISVVSNTKRKPEKKEIEH